MNGMGNMQGMMKQVKKMQKQMEQDQADLNQLEFTAESTNSYVKVVATGDRTIKEITIAPDIIDPEDPELLQDLLVTTVNDVIKKIDQKNEQMMGKYTQSIPRF